MAPATRRRGRGLRASADCRSGAAVATRRAASRAAGAGRVAATDGRWPAAAAACRGRRLHAGRPRAACRHAGPACRCRRPVAGQPQRRRRSAGARRRRAAGSPRRPATAAAAPAARLELVLAHVVVHLAPAAEDGRFRRLRIQRVAVLDRPHGMPAGAADRLAVGLLLRASFPPCRGRAGRSRRAAGRGPGRRAAVTEVRHGSGSTAGRAAPAGRRPSPGASARWSCAVIGATRAHLNAPAGPRRRPGLPTPMACSMSHRHDAARPAARFSRRQCPSTRPPRSGRRRAAAASAASPRRRQAPAAGRCSSVSRSAASPQATTRPVSPPASSSSPGAPAPATTAPRHSFTASPPSAPAAPGNGSKARSRRSIAAAGSAPVDLRLGLVDLVRVGRRPRPAAARRQAAGPMRLSSASTISRPPSARQPVVQRRRRCRRRRSASASASSMSPVSRPASICMMVMPVSRVAGLDGALDRRRAAPARQQRGVDVQAAEAAAASSTHCGRIRP